MAGDQIDIKISAQDNASPVLQKLAKNAQTVAQSLDAAGKEGSSSFQQMEKDANSTASAFAKIDSSGSGVIRTFGSMGSASDQFATSLVKIGSGMQSVGHAVDGLGQSYINQERQVAALDKMYGEFSQEMQDFAKEIQSTTLFSDDQARQAEIFFGTLKENYGLTIDQIKELTRVSADLAQTHGMLLEDAAQRVQAAIRGEGESAEALGLTMNQQSIDRDNLTLSMTNQEAAQFRLNALMQQSANVTGMSTEAVNTANGKWKQLGNSIQDAGQQAGAFVGPWGEILGTTGSSLATLGEAARGFREIGEGLKGLKTLAASGVGTFGLVGGAVAVASYGLVKMVGNIHDLKDGIAALDRIDTEFGLKGLIDSKLLLSDFRDEYDSLAKYLASGSGFAQGMKIPNEVQAEFTRVLATAFTDATVDSQAFFDWFITETSKLRAAGDDLGLSQFLSSINMGTLDQFRTGVNGATEDLAALEAAAKAAATSVKDIFKDLPSTLDDLRIDGKGKLANDLDSLSTKMQETFAPTYKGMSTDFAQDGWAAIAQASIDASVITEESSTRLDTSWERISSKMQSGMLDNAKVMEDVFSVLNNTSLNPDQKVAEIEKISNSMAVYIDKYAAMKDAQVEWLADGDNFLDWWKQYDNALRSNQRAMIDGTATAEQLKAANDKISAQKTFRVDVEIADGVQESSRALDQVLRTFGEIDAIGQRSSSAGSIADTLIGTPGEIGTLQEMWERLGEETLKGKLAYEDYTAAITAGEQVQQTQIRIQDDLNVVRAKQMPLLAQEQEAYADNIERISQLNAVEQRRVLMLQDTAVQSQVAALYSQAYAAAIGEVPKDVTTKMILEAAEADAGLKDLLLNLGLIQENSDGTISVNFPDAESVGSSIDRVTKALLYMQAAAEHKSAYQIAVEIYGQEEADRLFNNVAAHDGKTATVGVTVVSTGVDEAGNAVQTIKLADGTTVTVLVGVDGLGDLTKTDGGLKAITLKDGTVVTVKTDVDTSGWEDLNVDDLINGGQAVEVKTVLKPPTGLTADEWNATIGPLPEVTVDPKLGPIDTSQLPTDTTIQVTPVFGPAAGEGDGTGGAMAGWTPQEQQIVIDTKLGGTASADIDVLSGKVDEVDGKTATVGVTADASQAVIGLYNVQTQADTLDGKTSTVTVDATDNATAKVDSASNRLADVEGQMSTMYVAADTSDAETGIGWAQGFDGTVLSTAYIDIVTRQSTVSVGTPSSGGTYVRHGGIPGYAMGGVPYENPVRFEAGEAGREMAHFASGGMALIPDHRMYIAPPATYISPANAVPQGGGFGDIPPIHISIEGNVYGLDDLEAKVGGAVIRALASNGIRHKREQGIRI